MADEGWKLASSPVESAAAQHPLISPNTPNLGVVKERLAVERCRQQPSQSHVLYFPPEGAQPHQEKGKVNNMGRGRSGPPFRGISFSIFIFQKQII